MNGFLPILSVMVSLLSWVCIGGFYYFTSRWFYDCLWHTWKREAGYVVSVREYEFGTAFGVCILIIASILVTWYISNGGWLNFK